MARRLMLKGRDYAPAEEMPTYGEGGCSEIIVARRDFETCCDLLSSVAGVERV